MEDTRAQTAQNIIAKFSELKHVFLQQLNSLGLLGLLTPQEIAMIEPISLALSPFRLKYPIKTCFFDPIMY